MQAEKFETKSLVGSGENQSTNIYERSGGKKCCQEEENRVKGRKGQCQVGGLGEDQWWWGWSPHLSVGYPRPSLKAGDDFEKKLKGNRPQNVCQESLSSLGIKFALTSLFIASWFVTIVIQKNGGESLRLWYYSGWALPLSWIQTPQSVPSPLQPSPPTPAGRCQK